MRGGDLSPWNSQNSVSNVQVFVTETLGPTIFVFTTVLNITDQTS